MSTEKKCSRNGLSGIGVSLAVVFMFGLLPQSFAQTEASPSRYWACGNGWWDNTCWSSTAGGAATLGQPQSGDMVFLSQSDATNRMVLYWNTAYPSAVLNRVEINATGTGWITLSQSQHTLNADLEVVGRTGKGNFSQSGGTNTVTNLYLGESSGGNGTYSLNGTASLVAGRIEVGTNGTGTFNQGGGWNNVGTGLFLGVGSSGNGTYNLSGGGLTAYDEFVGYAGTGSFTQSGGSNQAITLNLAHSSGSSGSYTLSGGTLSVASITGGAGLSTFRLDTGTLDVGGALAVTNFYIGDAVGSNGSFGLSSGRTVTVNNEIIGMSGTGSFFQTGGTHTINNSLALGYNSGSSGVYGLYGGTLNVAGIMNGAGESTLNLNGGTLNLTGTSYSLDNLYVGGEFGYAGSLTLGSGKTLNVISEVVGYLGEGTVTQSGGTHTVGTLTLGQYASGSGDYTLSGGTLNVGSIVDGAGTGVLRVDGGTLNLTGSTAVLDTFLVGEASGSTGSFTLGTGKTLTVTNETIGGFGVGTLTQTGGTHSVAGEFNVGALGHGTYNLSGGTLSAISEVIGLSGSLSGSGTFNHSGGTHTVSDTLTLARFNGSSGTYTLSGGTLNVGKIARGEGSSAFNLNGGTLNLIGDSISVGSFNVGNATGSNVAFTLGSGKTLTANEVRVGGAGAGTFNQSGGTHTVGGSLYLGYSAGSSGTYGLSGSGSLSSENLVVGLAGSGAFTQSGGTNAVADGLYVGFFNTGTYNLSAGSLTTNKTILGVAGPGTFNQSGGTHTVADVLGLGTNNVGVAATYTLSGGTLNVGSIVEGAGNSTFNLDGGTLNLTGSSITLDRFNIGNAAGSNGSFSLGTGQTLTVSAETIGNNGTGALVQTGGAHTVGTLGINNGSYTLAGGTLTVNESLDNSGVFELAGGTLTGGGLVENNGLLSGHGTISGNVTFINNGLFVQSGGAMTFANTEKNINYGNMDLAGGLQLRLNGSTLGNSGAINLNGALVTGTGTLTNGASGTIAGRGSITSSFSNSGNVAVSGGTLNISKAFNNKGTIELGGAATSLTGGAITNTGTIQGAGTVANAITNTGTLEATAGVVNLTGSVNNNTGGIIRVSTGNKIAANGLASNAGLISLAGGTLDTNGKVLNSSGQITGYGVLATGGLTNSGVVTLSGGTTTVNGSVANAAAGKIEVANSQAVFTGNVVNSGLFKTTNASVTFAGGYTENGVYLSDPSDNYFTDLVVGASGYLLGGAGDNFFISGNFENHSLMNTAWNTDAASLILNGIALQNMYLAGDDMGAFSSGYEDNFAWGEFSLVAGASVNLLDGNDDMGAALYVGLVKLGSGLEQLASIHSPYNIYYDPTLAGNAFLHGGKFALNGGGYLMAATQPIPEPETWALMLAGLGLMGFAARRRMQ